MPGGADVVYPSAKRRQHEQVNAGGLVVSEMPPVRGRCSGAFRPGTGSWLRSRG